jgi:predicted metal-dependent enzyme (double-stranded beta helix superfamily)
LFDKPLYGYDRYLQEDKMQRYLEGISTQLNEARQTVNRLEGAQMLIAQLLDGNDDEKKA